MFRIANTIPEFNGFDNFYELIENNDLQKIDQIIISAKRKYGDLWYLKEDISKSVEAAVCQAIELGKLEVVRIFLIHELYPNLHIYHKTQYGHANRLIELAGMAGFLPIVKLLLEEYRADLSTENYNKRADVRIINSVVKSGNTNIVEYLFHSMKQADVHLRTEELGELLSEAAQTNNIPMIELLLSYGASIESALQSLCKTNYHEYREIEENLNRDNYKIEYKHQKIIDCEKLKSSFNIAFKILLDHAQCTDFSIDTCKYTERRNGERYGVDVFETIDLSAMNFIGISFGGKPVTKEMLINKNYRGAEKAIITLSDLDKMEDANRSEKIKERITNAQLQQGVMMNEMGIINLVPLYRAAQIGDMDTVKIRLAASNNPNSPIYWWDLLPPLVCAAKNGHLDIVKILAEHPLVDKKLFIGGIEASRKAQHMEIADYLLSLQDVNSKDADGNSPLHKAVENHDVELVQTLVSKNADVNAINDHKETPLILAARTALYPKSTKIIEILMTHGADPNLETHWSVLDLVVESGSYKSLALVLSRHDKKDIIQGVLICQPAYLTPWYSDVMFKVLHKKDTIPMLTLLKENGADFNWRYEGAWTLLHRAIIGYLPSHPCPEPKKSTKSYGRLYDNDYQRDKMQEEKLIKEAQDEYAKAIPLLIYLLDNGADVTVKGWYGFSVMHALVDKIEFYRLENEYFQLMQLLINKGADINAKDDNGETPLHRAVWSKNDIAIRHLIQLGADVDCACKSGLTPLGLLKNIYCSKKIDDAYRDMDQLLNATNKIYVTNLFTQ